MLSINVTRSLSLCGVVLLLAACSSNHLSVLNEKWKCKKENSKRHCLVTFKVSNSSHFPIDSEIRIRVHKRSYVMGSDALSNRVILEKPIHITISPNDTKEFKEKIIFSGSFDNIVISAWGNEV